MRTARASTPAPTTLRRIAELRERVAGWRRAGETVAVVPTMGALHEGHLELVRRARADCARVITTIFVNPIQFNRRDDLSGYPRDEAGDAAKLAALGVDLLFAPQAEEVYPEGFQTRVSVPELSDCLCGAARPGHMEGVATVVAKLLLTADQRARAPALFRVLESVAARLGNGEVPAQPELARGRAELAEAGFDPIDYLELRSADSLRALERAERPARLFAAAWLGQVRLIDNLAVGGG